MSINTFSIYWKQDSPFQKDQDLLKKQVDRELTRKNPAKMKTPTIFPTWGKGRCLFCLADLKENREGIESYYEYEYPRGPRGGYRKPIQIWKERELHAPECIGIKRMRQLNEREGSNE